MVQVPALKAKEVIAILMRAGFEFIRSKGSHHIYKMNNRLVVVPVHNKDLKRGTLSAIIKQSGLTVEQFIDLR